MRRKQWIFQRILCLWRTAHGRTQTATFSRRRTLQGTFQNVESVSLAHVAAYFLLQRDIDLPFVHIVSVLQDSLDDVMTELVPDELTEVFAQLVEQPHAPSLEVACSMIRW